MSKVFISYRRADSAEWAKRLYCHLSIRFGEDLIFQDVDDIQNEAMALLRLGRNDEDETALTQGETVFRSMLDEKPDDASAWNGLGSIQAVREDYEQALEYIERALQIAPDYPAALQDKKRILQQIT